MMRSLTDKAPRDWRNIQAGRVIPTEAYADQPYLVRTDDGAWLCVVTTGTGREGAPGQHIAAMRSLDQGRTWEERVDLEPPDGPEASYAVLLKTPGGRIYCFYNHNTDNRRWVIGDDPPYKDGRCERVDTQGHYVFRFSDDNGRTWSPQRFDIPVREMEIDRQNPYQGKTRFFWNVGKPFVRGADACVPLHKVGRFGRGFLARSEGVLLRSANLLSERDPEKILWETLPEGDIGLRAPQGGGPIAEEQSAVVLSDGSLFCVYRTVDGHPACAYSRDAGRTWTEPQYLRYADGRLVKHPRAANFVWNCGNGRCLYWFHNHGGRDYADRNPAWLCGGVEADLPEGKAILWSQPEIVLYDDDVFLRISYPDLLEENGRWFLTETQKNVARVHELDPTLLQGLWGQFTNSAVAREGLALDLPAKDAGMPSSVGMPSLPAFQARSARPDHGGDDLRSGFSIDAWVLFRTLTADQRVVDTRTPCGQGLCLRTTANGTLEITLNDGRQECRWDCDPGLLRPGALHHIAVIVDDGPKIITFVVDGRLCDGGETRQFGWGRFSPTLADANGGERLRIADNLDGEVRNLRVYVRPLRTSEAIGAFRAGPH